MAIDELRQGFVPAEQVVTLDVVKTRFKNLSEDPDRSAEFILKNCPSIDRDGFKDAFTAMVKSDAKECSGCRIRYAEWIPGDGGPPTFSVSPIGRSGGTAVVCADFNPAPLWGEQRCYVFDTTEKGAVLQCVVPTLFY